MMDEEIPGPSVICLPGLQGSKEVFEPFVKGLEGQARATALDLPPGSPRKAADALSDALDKRSDGPWHVVTGSYGGLVALHLPRRHVQSLALVATCPQADQLPATFRLQAFFFRVLPRFVAELTYKQRLRISLDVEGVPRSIASRVVARAPSAATLKGRLAGAADQRPGLEPEVPLLWIRGEHDAQVRWDDALVLESWPGARVTVVPGGHRPYASHARALTRVLLNYWNEVEKS